MSPRAADPAVRLALVEAAAKILAADGPNALTVRRLATEVGTSTMAVYTYFGGMTEVRRAVRREGFSRLAASLDDLDRTDDPVADLAAGGAVYVRHGLIHPHLYRAMFMDEPVEQNPAAPGTDTFQRLTRAVRQCVDAGRFEAVEPMMSLGWAVQLWTMRHGFVSLAITGLLPREHLPLVLTDMMTRLCVGFGDEPDAARTSVHNGMAEILCTTDLAG